MKIDPQLQRLIQKSEYQLPQRDLEERIMSKIAFVVSMKKVQQKNIRLSWIFLLLSAIFLPIFINIISSSTFFSYLYNLGFDLNQMGEYLMPAAILISAIIILVQVDNLYRLMVQVR